MARFTLLVLAGLLAFVPFGSGSPLDGGVSNEVEIGGERTFTIKKSFRANERAAVLALVQSQVEDTSKVNLSIGIYQKGTLIAEDKAAESSRFEFAAVFWYPPRDGEYLIEVRNNSTLPVPCWVAVK